MQEIDVESLLASDAGTPVVVEGQITLQLEPRPDDEGFSLSGGDAITIAAALIAAATSGFVALKQREANAKLESMKVVLPERVESIQNLNRALDGTWKEIAGLNDGSWVEQRAEEALNAFDTARMSAYGWIPAETSQLAIEYQFAFALIVRKAAKSNDPAWRRHWWNEAITSSDTQTPTPPAVPSKPLPLKILFQQLRTSLVEAIPNTR